MVTKRPHPTHWAGRLLKAAICALGVRGRPRRVVVSGDSMLPSFRPGDRLVVLPVARIAPGQVVALRDPTEPARMLVKRVLAVVPDGLEVRGDNEAASTDSRHFGPVPIGGLVGRAVYRYHPPERSGWLAG